MTACENVGPLLDGYHDDELDAFERRRVEQHLTTCNACREDLASLGAIGQAVRAAVAGASAPDLWDAIARDLPPARRESASPRLRAPRRRRLLPAAAAAAVAASAFLLYWIEPPDGGPSGVVRSVYAPEHPVMVLEADQTNDPTIIWLMNETPEATHVRI